MSIIHSTKKGFTLVESLVAMSIILVSVTAAFSVGQSGLSSSIRAKERVTAYFLAQEAIEAIKSARDGNNLTRYRDGGSSPTWLTGITDGPGAPCAGGATCDWSIDVNDVGEDGVDLGEFVVCDGSNDNCLLRRDSDGLYNYLDDSGGVSPYRRQITISSIPFTSSSREVKVTVEVSWGGGQSVVVEENIFNWSVPLAI